MESAIIIAARDFFSRLDIIFNPYPRVSRLRRVCIARCKGQRGRKRQHRREIKKYQTEKKEKRNRQGSRKELHLQSYTFAAQLTKVSIVRCKKTTSQLGRSKLGCDTIERCRGWNPSKSSKNAFSRRFSVARPPSRFR